MVGLGGAKTFFPALGLVDEGFDHFLERGVFQLGDAARLGQDDAVGGFFQAERGAVGVEGFEVRHGPAVVGVGASEKDACSKALGL